MSKELNEAEKALASLRRDFDSVQKDVDEAVFKLEQTPQFERVIRLRVNRNILHDAIEVERQSIEAQKVLDEQSVADVICQAAHRSCGEICEHGIAHCYSEDWCRRMFGCPGCRLVSRLTLYPFPCTNVCGNATCPHHSLHTFENPDDLLGYPVCPAGGAHDLHIGDRIKTLAKPPTVLMAFGRRYVLE